MGEAKQDALRVDFDGQIRLEFHGAKITSDAGLLTYREFDEALGLMTERRIRHLPVMDGDRLIGVVSIGDLVKETIAEQQQTIRQLESYIHS